MGHLTDRRWGQQAFDLFDRGFTVEQVFDDGTGHTNEVALVRLANGEHVVSKVMLARPAYHQRLKALMEIAVARIDEQLGGDRVVQPISARPFHPSAIYDEAFGPEQPERPRIAHLLWKYARGIDGQQWYKQVGAGGMRKAIMQSSSAARLALIDLLVINQDRSLRNWVTDGKRFCGIDNGMAWYNQQPYFFNPAIWGCGVKCLIQESGWRPIAGVFSTSYAGHLIPRRILEPLRAFDPVSFYRAVDHTADELGFPRAISGDFRFEGIVRRIRWFARAGRLPTREEYYAWRPVEGHGDGSPLMNARKMLADGARAIWRPDWKFRDDRHAEEIGDYRADRAGPRTEWAY